MSKITMDRDNRPHDGSNMLARQGPLPHVTFHNKIAVKLQVMNKFETSFRSRKFRFLSVSMLQNTTIGTLKCKTSSFSIWVGLDLQGAIKLARKLHTHSVYCAHKLATTTCAVENKNIYHSRVLEQGACSKLLPVTLQNPTSLLCPLASWWRGFTALEPTCLHFQLM